MEHIKFSITSRAITSTYGMRETNILEIGGGQCVLRAGLYSGVDILLVCDASVSCNGGVVQNIWLFDMKFAFKFYSHLALLFMLEESGEYGDVFTVSHLNGGNRVLLGRLGLYKNGAVIFNGSPVSTVNSRRIFTKALVVGC